MGMLRLRKCSEETFRPELKGACSIVRELHVYGSVVPVNARDPTKFQHQVCHVKFIRGFPRQIISEIKVHSNIKIKLPSKELVKLIITTYSRSVKRE